MADDHDDVSLGRSSSVDINDDLEEENEDEAERGGAFASDKQGDNWWTHQRVLRR